MPARTLCWRHALVALAFLVVAAALPALRGSFVYDDRLMIGHPLMSHAADVFSSFRRNSAAYMNAGGQNVGIHGSPTYRPLPMASLILVNATCGSAPLVHHLLSLFLHLLVVAVLLRLLAAPTGRLTLPRAVLATIFALHPTLCEAYDWINGRSDVMAGAALMLLAATAMPPVLSPLRSIVTLLLLCCGALCKETFLIASGALLAAAALMPSSDGRRLPTAARLAGLWLLSALLFLFLRRATLSDAGGGMTLDPLVVLRRAPALLALSAEEVLVPLPRAMLHLSWELPQPQPLLLLLVPALVLALVLRRREWARGALLLGAAATMLPTALVADSFWLGLDRYLYMPLCLLALMPIVGSVVAPDAIEPTSGWRPSPGWALCAGVALILAGECALTAGNYRSQRVFAESILRGRPDEPTGYILVAEDALDHDDRDRAQQALALLPRKDLPPIMAHKVVQVDLAAGRTREAMALLEETASRYLLDPNVRFDLLALRAGQRRWDQVVQLAGDLARDPLRRPAVRDLCRRWLADPGLPPPVREGLRRITTD